MDIDFLVNVNSCFCRHTLSSIQLMHAVRGGDLQVEPNMLHSPKPLMSTRRGNFFSLVVHIHLKRIWDFLFDEIYNECARWFLHRTSVAFPRKFFSHTFQQF